MRLTTLLLLAISTAAADAATITLPASPGPTATVTLHPTGGGSIPLNLPGGYPTDGGPAFGKSGDVEGPHVLVGAPEAWWDGVAFVYDSTTGAHLHTLTPGTPLGGGASRPQLGYKVMLWEGLAFVTAPNAGYDGDFQNRGAVLIFDPATGAKLQTIWGPDGFYGMGLGLYTTGGKAYGTAISRTTGAAVDFQLAIVPEPSSLLLAAIGLLAARRRSAF